MTKVLGRYKYTYGSGNQPNREILFLGDGAKVLGNVKGKFKNEWKDIGRIREDDMFTEIFSTSEKVTELILARKENRSPSYPLERKLCDLNYQDKVKLITGLDDTYQITMINDIGLNPQFETIKRIIFFNPS